MTEKDILNHKLETGGRISLPPQVNFVIERLEREGFEAYAVGGCVRDHVMGNTPGDYDVTTSATPEEMLRVFSDTRVVETGLKHGTVTVVKDGMNIETTTYRIDGSYADGRHPTSVEFTKSLSEDLLRRDFTMNAMAYSDAVGIVDLYGGVEDIKNRIIRCVGNANERFSEDGLRIMRALRFSSVLGFSPDGECSEGVFRLTPLLSKISRERIYTELTKLICGMDAQRVLSEFASVIAHVIPNLTEEGVKKAAFLIGRERSRDCAVRYALLFESLTQEESREAMRSLKPSSDERRRVEELISKRGAEIRSEYDVLCLMRDHGDSFPERFASFEFAAERISLEKCENICKTAEYAVLSNKVRSVSDLEINGGDVAERGYTGAEIGGRLRELLDLVMLEKTENRRDVLLSLLEDKTKKEVK